VKALAIASWDFMALCEQDFKVAEKVMVGMATLIRKIDNTAGR
jgi:hypothetical protein